MNVPTRGTPDVISGGKKMTLLFFLAGATPPIAAVIVLWLCPIYRDPGQREMPFVYLHRSDGKRFHKDRAGRYFLNECQVRNEAKRILAATLLETEMTGDTLGLSVEAHDLSGRTIFQVSVVASVWLLEDRIEPARPVSQLLERPDLDTRGECILTLYAGKSQRLISPASSVFPHSMIWSDSGVGLSGGHPPREIIDRTLIMSTKANVL
jgi:hypothetical protein